MKKQEKKAMSESICKWMPSPIFPNEYLVSNCGDVYSLVSKKNLKPNIDKSGYYYFVLCVNGNRRTVKAHRLVAVAFIPNTYNKPTVNHKNGIRTDNRVENLEWATHKEQSNDPNTKPHLLAALEKRDFRGMGAKRDFGRKPVVVVRLDGTQTHYPSLLAAARDLGVNYGHLSETLNGKRKQRKQFWIRKA